MKLHRISIAALVLALVGLFAVPNSAQAQQQQGQANFGNLVAALNNVNAQVQALQEAEINENNVHIVDIEEIYNNLNENQVETLNNAFRDADVDVLTNAVQDNETLNNSLNDNNVQASDVVAVDVASGGDVVVYVDEEGVLESNGTLQ